jgi:hypothetical protein
VLLNIVSVNIIKSLYFIYVLLLALATSLGINCYKHFLYMVFNLNLVNVIVILYLLENFNMYTFVQ